MTRVIKAGIPALLALTFLSRGGAAIEQETAPSAESVLRELKEGNAHHAAHRYTHPHETPARQQELAKGQHPHATILSCADSRVPPEIIFDQGLGDLFTVRSAGHVAGDIEIGSVEYAVAHLHTPLLVVMGHQGCGAVTAAVEGGEAIGHTLAFITPILPAVEQGRKLPGNAIENAVRINVERVVEQLRTSRPVLADQVARGKLRVVGAVCSLDTGKVTWLPEPAAK
jgi:carbonic anhydrase